MLDWDKPIEFENGEPCVLISTHPEGSPNFPNCTRVVHRTAEENVYVAIWWYKEDGKSNWPGYNIVNIEGTENDQ